MSKAEYIRGIDFIKRTSGTPGEMKARLEYWIREAGKLVGKQVPDIAYA